MLASQRALYVSGVEIDKVKLKQEIAELKESYGGIASSDPDLKAKKKSIGLEIE